MGDWRRVQIVGSCGVGDVPLLKSLLTCNSDFSNFHCLIDTKGISGLPNWANENISAVGNLGERGYDEEDVAEQLEVLVDSCPTLDVRIHVGGENESNRCVATVSVCENGCVVGEPAITDIPEIDQSQLRGRMPF